MGDCTSIGYLVPFFGIGGKMVLKALPDAGVSMNHLREESAHLPISGYPLTAEPVSPRGLSGTHSEVQVEEEQQPQRHLPEI